MIPTITETHSREMSENGYTIFEGIFSEDEMHELSDVLVAYERRMHDKLLAQGDSGISRAGEITFTDHIAEQDER